MKFYAYPAVAMLLAACSSPEGGDQNAAEYSAFARGHESTLGSPICEAIIGQGKSAISATCDGCTVENLEYAFDGSELTYAAIKFPPVPSVARPSATISVVAQEGVYFPEGSLVEGYYRIPSGALDAELSLSASAGGDSAGQSRELCGVCYFGNDDLQRKSFPAKQPYNAISFSVKGNIVPDWKKVENLEIQLVELCADS